MAIRYSWDLIMGVRSKAGDLVGGVSINFQLHVLDLTPSPRIPARQRGIPTTTKPVRFPKAHLKGLRELDRLPTHPTTKKAHLLRSFRFSSTRIFFWAILKRVVSTGFVLSTFCVEVAGAQSSGKTVNNKQIRPCC